MIEAICTVVPKEKVLTIGEEQFPLDMRERFIHTTGIKERRISQATTEDLMVTATAFLVDTDLAFDAIVTVTQTPEFKMPGPGFFIAKRFGLEGGAIFDLNAACDGYVKGLSLASILAQGMQANVLLLVGDTLGSFMPRENANVGLIFGNAASATIVKPAPLTELYTTSFPGSVHSLYVDDKPHMDGEAVTQFAIQKVPIFMEKNGLKGDVYYFHQANRIILSMIEKRLKLKPQQVPKTYEFYGNTSSCSIPLTLCLKPPQQGDKEIVLCGFGAGLSISAMKIPKPEFTLLEEV